MDADKVLEELRTFIRLCDQNHEVWSSGGAATTHPTHRELQSQEPVVKRIIEAVDISLLGIVRSHARGGYEWDWRGWADAARKAVTLIERGDDIAQMLGPSGPRLSAADLHPKVWQVASAYWSSGHYDDAVEAAAKIVRTMARARLGKPNLKEANVGDAFSTDDPKEGSPRFRFPGVDPEDTETWTAMHAGALHYAKGCFMALRNPRAHAILDTDEQVALEHLAAFSVLARWIDEADVVEFVPTLEDLQGN